MILDEAKGTVQTQSESSRQSSSSGSVGVSLASTGLSATASASRGQGQGSGSGTTYTNTRIEGQSVQITSGGDTTLKGAVVQGDQVNAQVGGNLGIESLQDSNRYSESSRNAGFSVSVPITGNASASVNAGKTNISSNYQSVGEQSGLRAGDGGFQVSVAGKTDLVGGQITSTQAAIDNKQNSYQAQGGTSTRDLNNSASFEASSVSVGLGAGTPKPGASLSAGLSGVGIGSDSGSASSTTTAAISGMAGNTAARTGDAETGIKPIFDKDRVKAEVNAQVAITQEFGKQASKAVGDHAKEQYDKAKAAGDKEGMAAWAEGGKNRVALHVLVGGLTGGAQAAVGAGAASAAAPKLEELQAGLKTALTGAGVGEDAANLIASLAGGATAAGIGGATGGTAGAATAFNADMNNRALHPDERRKAAELARKSGGKYTQREIEEQMRLMGNAQLNAQPNTTTVLTNTEAIAENLKSDPGMPKAVQGSVVVEVPGMANSELRNWIIGNTKDVAGDLPPSGVPIKRKEVQVEG